MNELTIAIIIKDPPKIKEFLEGNKDYLEQYFVLVINSSGGSSYAPFADLYEEKQLCLAEARKYIIGLIQTPYVLILDADVIIPEGYPEMALQLLKEGKVDAISIFYEDVTHNRGTLEFGCSIWKTKVLQELYDYSFSINNSNKALVQVGPHHWSTLNNGWCECTYMWGKIKKYNLLLETLPFRARHLRTGGLNAKG